MGQRATEGTESSRNTPSGSLGLWLGNRHVQHPTLRVMSGLGVWYYLL